MKKEILCGVFSLLLMMAFVPGAAVGEDVEKPEGLTEAVPTEAEISVEQTTDTAFLSKTVVSSEVASSELPDLLSEPSLQADDHDQAIDLDTIALWGVCSLSCTPCNTNTDCPRPQKCVSQCL